LLRPIDAVRCFHNAFRRDMSQIDTLVLNIAREGGDMAPIFDRLIIDHRELDNMVLGLEAIREAPDPLATARATAVLNSHLRIHLNKEDVHLYPILRERTTDDEQVSIGKVMASKTPPERSSIQAQWLFPLLDLDDQVTVTRVWMALMPPPVFTMLKPLIKKSASANWAMLTQQIPELSDR
jgi:hemerythrin-like domain-containing protein